MIASRLAKFSRILDALDRRTLKSRKAREKLVAFPIRSTRTQTDMSEITSASPAAKRARLAESRASNVLALQTYRIRVTLPLAMGKYGKRVFDVHQEATFDELHEAICTSFNRGLG